MRNIIQLLKADDPIVLCMWEKQLSSHWIEQIKLSCALLSSDLYGVMVVASSFIRWQRTVVVLEIGNGMHQEKNKTQYWYSRQSETQFPNQNASRNRSGSSLCCHTLLLVTRKQVPCTMADLEKHFLRSRSRRAGWQDEALGVERSQIIILITNFCSNIHRERKGDR